MPSPQPALARFGSSETLNNCPRKKQRKMERLPEAQANPGPRSPGRWEIAGAEKWAGVN